MASLQRPSANRFPDLETIASTAGLSSNSCVQRFPFTLPPRAVARSPAQRWASVWDLTPWIIIGSAVVMPSCESLLMITPRIKKPLSSRSQVRSNLIRYLWPLQIRTIE